MSVDYFLESLFSSGKLQNSRYAATHKSDALRYLLLYKFGGFYLDMDYVVLQDLSHYGKALVKNKVPNQDVHENRFSKAYRSFTENRKILETIEPTESRQFMEKKATDKEMKFPKSTQNTTAFDNRKKTQVRKSNVSRKQIENRNLCEFRKPVENQNSIGNHVEAYQYLKEHQQFANNRVNWNLRH